MVVVSRPDFHGVSYPDRHKIMVGEGAVLTIYVPKPGFHTMGVAPRSGIVGETLGEKVLCHYEGWVHGAMQYEHLDARGKWEAAIVTAADRAFVQYPTVAKGLFDADGLIPVGTIAAAGVYDVTDEEAVAEWLSR